MLSLDTIIESLTQNKVFTAIKPGRYEQAVSLKPTQYSFPSMTRPKLVAPPKAAAAAAADTAVAITIDPVLPLPDDIVNTPSSDKVDLKTERYTLPKLRALKLAGLQEIASKLDIDISVIGANSKSKPKTRDTLIAEIYTVQEKRTLNNN